MLISLIIPAYNCSGTLMRAVSSCEGLEGEIIIVDDGSSDSTPEVIKKIKSERLGVRSVRTENGGPARARNTGIDAALGEYVMFLDSDDEFLPGAFKLASESLKERPDMLIFGFRQSFANTKEVKHYVPEGEFDICDYYAKNLLNQVWNKAYRTDFLRKNGIRFKNYRYGEDRLFNADALERSPTIKTLCAELYDYKIDSQTSLTSRYVPEKLDAVKQIDLRFKHLCGEDGRLTVMFLKGVLSCMTVLYSHGCALPRKKKREEIKKILTDEYVRERLATPIDSKYLELIRLIIGTRSAFLNIAMCKFVCLSSKYAPRLYLRLRK